MDKPNDSQRSASRKTHCVPRITCWRSLGAIAALALLSLQSAYATNVSLSGSYGYRNWNSTTVVLNADRVENNERGGTSGTLYLELWACNRPSLPASCYDVASYRLGELAGGSYYYSVSSGTISARRPPDGVYSMILAVVEYPALSTAVTYGALSGTVTIGDGGGGSVTPPPANVDDFGNSRSRAHPMGLNARLIGRIHSASDADYFRFKLSRRGILRLSTVGRLDTVGTLYNARGSVLTIADDNCGNGTRNFCMNRRLDPGTYYLKVDGFRTKTGSYNLRSSFR